MTSADSREQLVQSLRGQLVRLERPSVHAPTVVTTGCAGVDELLPQRGLSLGTLVEWLAAVEGSGAATLALVAAREVCRSGRALVVVDSGRNFYPPAAALWGVDWQRLVVVRATEAKDVLWAWDQSLRCPAVGAVWGRTEKLRGQDFRRLQLAAESGGTIGLLLRSARLRGQPSWADVQFLVEPQGFSRRPTLRVGQLESGRLMKRLDSESQATKLEGGGRRLRVEVTRCRGGVEGKGLELEINEETGAIYPVTNQHETHPLPAIAELARAAAARRSAGA